jgi:hypothetical protein
LEINPLDDDVSGVPLTASAVAVNLSEDLALARIVGADENRDRGRVNDLRLSAG